MALLLSGCTVNVGTEAEPPPETVSSISVEEWDIVACETWWEVLVLPTRGPLRKSVPDDDFVVKLWDDFAKDLRSALSVLKGSEGRISAEISRTLTSHLELSEWVVESTLNGTRDTLTHLNWPIHDLPRNSSAYCASLFGETWSN